MTLSPALLSSVRMDWQTPDHVLDAVRSRLGEIDLDPCTSAENPTRARVFLTEGGLECPWSEHGLTWVNPPYRRELPKWVSKAKQEEQLGAEVVLLVPARTDTRWWHDNVWQSSICYIRGRLTFVGAPAPAPFPSALIYMGPRDFDFYEGVKHLGHVVVAV